MWRLVQENTAQILNAPLFLKEGQMGRENDGVMADVDPDLNGKKGLAMFL